MEEPDAGVSLRCAPGRASRAVGNDTAGAPWPRLVPSTMDAGAPASRPSGRESLTQPPLEERTSWDPYYIPSGSRARARPSIRAGKESGGAASGGVTGPTGEAPGPPSTLRA